MKTRPFRPDLPARCAPLESIRLYPVLIAVSTVLQGRTRLTWGQLPAISVYQARIRRLMGQFPVWIANPGLSRLEMGRFRAQLAIRGIFLKIQVLRLVILVPQAVTVRKMVQLPV